MGKFLRNLVVIIYIIIIIFVTICLLSYNKYKVTEFGDNSLIIIDEDLATDFQKGDLLIVKKNNNKDIKLNQKIFFYTTAGGKVNINYGSVVEKEDITATETTYTLEGNYNISSEYVIGKGETATVIPKVGTVLGVLQSKWGYLLLVVFPTLIAFLYEITVIISEVKEGKNAKEEEKEGKKVDEEK